MKKPNLLVLIAGAFASLNGQGDILRRAFPIEETPQDLGQPPVFGNYSSKMNDSARGYSASSKDYNARTNPGRG